MASEPRPQRTAMETHSVFLEAHKDAIIVDYRDLGLTRTATAWGTNADALLRKLRVWRVWEPGRRAVATAIGGRPKAEDGRRERTLSSRRNASPSGLASQDAYWKGKYEGLLEGVERIKQIAEGLSRSIEAVAVALQAANSQRRM